MYKLKNGITLVGKYAGEASKAVSSLADSIYIEMIDPVLDKIANIDIATVYFGNPDIPEDSKYRALRRNIITNESAILGIGKYPTGKKPEMGIGLIGFVLIAFVGAI